jgi:hypothetical protein
MTTAAVATTASHHHRPRPELITASTYSAKAWRDVRAQALSRAGHRCEARGCRTTKQLVVHHIDELGLTGPRALDLGNVRVLCRYHHALAHEHQHQWPPRD